MLDAKTAWSGRLICPFQPDDERGSGAQAMVDNGLYEKLSRPDVILRQHVIAKRAGSFEMRSGLFMASVDSYRVTIFGRGGMDLCLRSALIRW